MTQRILHTYCFYCIALVMIVFVTGCDREDGAVAPPPTPPTPTPPATNEVDFWLTKGNRSVKLQKQTDVLAFRSTVNMYPTIEVNETTTYQTVDGFGYTLTGGSAEVINSLAPPLKSELLQELFGTGNNAIAISYLRISIGASDLNSMPFTYNDLAEGETDLALEKFSFGEDATLLLPLLKQIVAINPAIKIMATPWTPPVWMKDNNSFVGGSLQPQYYSVYAQYFVKYFKK